MEVFLLQLKISALLDCVLFSPYIAWNMWQFVLPALYDNEKRFIRSIVAMTSGLFIAGVAFCLIVCFPLIVQFVAKPAARTHQRSNQSKSLFKPFLPGFHIYARHRQGL